MRRVRIARIDVFARERPILGGGFTIAGTRLETLDSTILRVTAEDGTEGWGETCPVGRTYAPAHGEGARAAIAALAPGLVGLALSHPRGVHAAMDRRLNGHAYAKAAVDIALHDIFGKVLGMRVADLVGGAVVERVPSYHSIGAVDPDTCARDAAAHAEAGFTRFQLKIGGRPVGTDIAAVRAVSAVLGPDMRLAVDGNRALTTRDALLLDRVCADIPFVFEQPCDTLAEIEILRRSTGRPVYLDECGTDLATVVRAAGLGLCDGFAMKLTRLGGIAPMSVFREICAARNMPHTCDDSWGGDIVAAACVHVAATVAPRLLDGAWIAAPYIEGHDCAAGGVAIEAGQIRLPVEPGLGIAPDAARLGPPVASYGTEATVRAG